MNVCLLAFVHMNAGGFLPVRAIKMDSVFVCVIWLRLRCIRACTQGMGGYRKCGFLEMCVCVCISVLVCVFLRGLLCLRDCEFGSGSGQVETSRWNLFGFGSSQQAMIGEPRVPPGRWTPGDHRVIHPTQIDMETALGCWVLRLGGGSKIMCTRAYTQRLSVSGGAVWETPNFHQEQKREEGLVELYNLNSAYGQVLFMLCYFDGTVFTKRNTYQGSACAGRNFDLLSSDSCSLTSWNSCAPSALIRQPVVWGFSYLRIVCFIDHKLAYTAPFLISSGRCFRASNTHTHTHTHTLTRTHSHTYTHMRLKPLWQIPACRVHSAASVPGLIWGWAVPSHLPRGGWRESGHP